MARDYYEVLGVSNRPPKMKSEKHIASWAQYHPDRNPGDKKAESQFKEVQEATTF